MSERSELLETANDLGLEFKKNISSVKLTEMINQATNIEPIKESAPAGPAKKAEKPIDNAIVDVASGKTPATPKEIAKAKNTIRRRQIAKARAAAFKKRIVTITNKDNRENDVATTAYLAFENQYFGMAKNVPLDVAVELETALIKIAAGCTMTLHKAETKSGKPTGNRVSVTVKKYAISYSQQQPNE